MKRYFLLSLMCALCFPAFAEPEEPKVLEKRNSLYVHPLSFVIVSAMKGGYPVFLTYERALGGGHVSLLAVSEFFPTKLTVEDQYGPDNKVEGVVGGAGLHVRKYLMRPHNGLFFETGVNLEYMTFKDQYSVEAVGGAGTGLFMVGYKLLRSHFAAIINAGAGVQTLYLISGDVPASGTGFGYDINLAFGIPF